MLLFLKVLHDVFEELKRENHYYKVDVTMFQYCVFYACFSVDTLKLDARCVLLQSLTRPHV